MADGLWNVSIADVVAAAAAAVGIVLAWKANATATKALELEEDRNKIRFKLSDVQIHQDTTEIHGAKVPYNTLWITVVNAGPEAEIKSVTLANKRGEMINTYGPMTPQTLGANKSDKYLVDDFDGKSTEYTDKVSSMQFVRVEASTGEVFELAHPNLAEFTKQARTRYPVGQNFSQANFRMSQQYEKMRRAAGGEDEEIVL